MYETQGENGKLVRIKRKSLKIMSEEWKNRVVELMERKKVGTLREAYIIKNMSHRKNAHKKRHFRKPRLHRMSKYQRAYESFLITKDDGVLEFLLKTSKEKAKKRMKDLSYKYIQYRKEWSKNHYQKPGIKERVYYITYLRVHEVEQKEKFGCVLIYKDLTNEQLKEAHDELKEYYAYKRGVPIKNKSVIKCL